MSKIIDKIITSSTAPNDTNVLWDDGKTLKIFRNGKWESVSKGDWNAQKGEPGYIENKPITKKFIKEQSMEFSHVDEWGSVYEGYDAVPSNTTVAKVFADITTDEGEHITTTVIVQNGSDVDILENGEENYLEISMYDTSKGLTMYVSSSLGVSGTLKCYYYEKFKQLDEDYIPDIVLKTTPQTLSYADKNQALANLGINPVVWKYMSDPYVINTRYDSGTIPKDLIPIIFNNDGTLRDIVYKLIVCDNGLFKKRENKNTLWGPEDETIGINTDGTWSLLN